MYSNISKLLEYKYVYQHCKEIVIRLANFD